MRFKKTILFIISSFFLFHSSFAQETVSTSGGNIQSESGTVSFTIGQVFFNSYEGTNGLVSMGVQHAYTISEVTGIENKMPQLRLSVYPNPTTDLLMLHVDEDQLSEIAYNLIDMQGRHIDSQTINTTTTSIDMQSLNTNTYILSITHKGSIIKSFKIIKK